jgi:hypothetical protein
LEEDVFEVANGENIQMKDFEDKGEKLSNQTINFLAKSARTADKQNNPIVQELNHVDEEEDESELSS